MIYHGFMISDIHFGANDSSLLYDELKGVFIKKILEEKDKLDFIVICGDLFDTKISLNSSHADYAFKFLQELIDICSDNNIKLRIIKGTEFHDNKQLNLIPYLSTKSCDLRVISTAMDELLFDDFKVLYLPEEYMEDMNEFYSPFFNKNLEYDMIFGHGMMEEMVFVASTQQSEVTMKRAPIYSSNTLQKICKGPIFFGHIHTSQKIKETIFYMGSYSRWIFGESNPKGFISVNYNTEFGSFEVEFIENYMAPKYNTVTIDDDKFYELSPEIKIQTLSKLIEDNKDSQFLRFKLNVPEKYSDDPTLDTIQKAFSKKKGLKVIINRNAARDKKRKEINEKIDKIISMYDFILDQGISPEEKISRFIKVKYMKDITVEDIRKYIYGKETGR